jgi:hypothetical protein
MIGEREMIHSGTRAGLYQKTPILVLLLGIFLMISCTSHGGEAIVRTSTPAEVEFAETIFFKNRKYDFNAINLFREYYTLIESEHVTFSDGVVMDSIYEMKILNKSVMKKLGFTKYISMIVQLDGQDMRIILMGDTRPTQLSR